MKADKRTLELRDGTKLHLEIKEMGSPYWIVATHGIGEHLGRHKYLSRLFGQDFNILQYDLRGHGKSGGEPAYIDNFDTFFHDLHEVLLFLKTKYKMEKYILFGHSMGALITAGYMQNIAHESMYPELVFLNAPPVGVSGVLGGVVEALPRNIFTNLSKLPLSLKVGGLVDLSYLSHNSQVKEDYELDELNHLKLHTKLLVELVRASKSVFSRPLRVNCKAICTYGSEDKVIGTKYLQNYFSHVEKSFKLYQIDGAYHEIHNEIEKYKRPYFEVLKQAMFENIYPDYAL